MSLRPRALRVTLALLALTTFQVGAPAWLAPRAFYDNFPWVGAWVSQHPPYNVHLVTDVGGLYLGFAVLFAWAAVTLHRHLALAACVAFAVPAALHLAFHATHPGDAGTGDAVAQFAALGGQLVLTVVGVVLARRAGPS